MGEDMNKLFNITVLIVLVDRLFKMLVTAFLPNADVYVIKNVFYLTYATNKGAAFSMFEGKTFLFILFAVFILASIYYYIKKYNINNIGYSFLCGGIIGNLIDRIIYGYVIDFIGINIFNYRFPIFNIADIFIVLGALFVVIGRDKNESSSK